MLALGLALSSSLAWGVADFIGGLKSRTLPVASVMIVAIAAGLVLAFAIVGIRGVEAPPARFLAFGALSAVAGTIGLAAFYRALAIGSMSVVAPIAASGAAVPLAVGLASGERPSVVQGLGAAVAITGVVFAAREPDPDSAAVERVSGSRSASVAPGAALALLAALGLGSFLVFLDAASEGDVAWAILFNRVVSLALIVLAMAVLRPRPPAGLREAAPALAVGVLETTANILIAIATTIGLVSLVGVLGSLYPVVTVALARVVLGERISRGQQLGAAGALAGVVLIGAG